MLTTLDAEMIKSLTKEAARELELPCEAESVAQLMGSTTWYIRFTDGHPPFFNDFREYVGGPYEESLVKERIKNYLLSQHTQSEGPRA
ncbi:MAG: hypothetical protein ICV60_14640 [Pyrinomonadaceae bacterium]|nr:hypothetical protein [Pyrinomonadaceae bacterium]